MGVYLWHPGYQQWYLLLSAAKRSFIWTKFLVFLKAFYVTLSISRIRIGHCFNFLYNSKDQVHHSFSILQALMLICTSFKWFYIIPRDLFVASSFDFQVVSTHTNFVVPYLEQMLSQLHLEICLNFVLNRDNFLELHFSNCQQCIE